MKFINFLIFLTITLIFSSCGVSVMAVHDPGKDISRNIKKTAVANDAKKYKRMKACEEKFMRRFSRLYAKQQKQTEDENLTTPFFSTNANQKN